MLSSALSQLLERARTRFGLEVDVFDSSLRSLYPEAGSELSRMIDASPAMRRALHDVMMGGRSQQVGEGDRRYRLFPLRSGARRRAGAGVLAIRRAGAAPHVDDAEPWSELARAVVEADLAAGDLVGEERLRSRRLSGVLRFLDFLIAAESDQDVQNALLQAAAIWYDADARLYRRDLAGRFELHGLLPGARIAPGSAQLDPSVVGPDTGIVRLTSAGELTEAVFGHEAVLVPLSGEAGVDWVLALFGQVPAEADAMLATIGRIAGRQLEAIARRRSAAVRDRFEASLRQTAVAPELLALRVLDDLCRSAGASGASLTLVRRGQERRIAAVGAVPESRAGEQGEVFGPDRISCRLVLGVQDYAVLALRSSAEAAFTPDAVATVKACAGALATWIAGATSSFDEASVLLDAAVGEPDFARRIQEELERALRFDLRLSLILLDVGAPSDALATLQEQLRRELRGSDVTGTVRGRQVAALLTHTDELGLGNVVRRLRARLADIAEQLQVSDLTLGQAAASPECRTADALLSLAARQAERLVVH